MPVLVAALMFASAASGAAAAPTITARPPGPVVHVVWHRVVGGVESAYANGSSDYLTLTTGTDGSGDTSLFDPQTGARTPLMPPGCPSGGSPAGLGGGSLALDCTEPDASDQADLYDLATGTWAQIPIGFLGCSTDQIPLCHVTGVGTTWIRFSYIPDIAYCEHTCEIIDYLQNIATGAIKPDPANILSSDTLDDLNSPTGVAPDACPRPSPSAYSSPSGSPSKDFELLENANWQQLGDFGLETTYFYPSNSFTTELEKCQSKLRLKLPGIWFGSSNAIVSMPSQGPNAGLIEGRWLPSLKPFIIRHQAGVAAVRNRTLYALSGGFLWTGTLPH